MMIRKRRWFPWRTLILLGLTTYLLIVVLSIWWHAFVNALAVGLLLAGGPAWQVTVSFNHYFPGEPWVDAVVLHAGALFILWRCFGLLRTLWRRFGWF